MKVFNLNLAIFILFVFSCDSNFPPDVPPIPDPPLIDTLCEDGTFLISTYIHYPFGDTLEGAMYAVKNNMYRRFTANCSCGIRYFNSVPYFGMGASTSYDPYPLYYGSESMGFSYLPLRLDSFNLLETQLPIGVAPPSAYITSYNTSQHDVTESSYILDSLYRCQFLKITKLDLENKYAEGEFNVQFILHKIHDKEYKNPPEIIRLAKGKFWCKLNK